MRNYVVCSGNTPVTCPTYWSAQSNCESWYTDLNGIYNRKLYQIRTNPLGSPAGAPADYTYRYRREYTIMVDGVQVYAGIDYGYIYVPALTVDHQFYLICNQRLYGGGGSETDELWTFNYYEEYQESIPTCYTPPACALDITGSTVTAPIIRGDSDGSIQIWITGQTNPTDWYLQGECIFSGSTNATETFTGLTAGNYNIYIIDVSGCTASLAVAIPEGEFRTGNFIVSTPATITAVENPIILGLQTNINSINPLQSINTIQVTGATISGISITFALTFPQIYNAVFISKAYPDRSNYFLETTLKDSIGTPQGTNTNTEITTSLAEALQQDSVISRLYYITNSGTTVTLTSREYGDMYDLSGNTNVTIVGTGVTLTNTQSGRVAYDGQLASNYSLYVELYVNKDLQFGATPVLTDYERVAELELPFNNTNTHRFDLSTILKNFVSSPKIDFAMTGFTTNPAMDTTYYCKYGEKYPLIPNTNTKKKRYKGETGVLYTLNSALDFETPNDMSAYLGTLCTGFTASTVYTGITFMNIAPNPKFISRGSKEYLYYLLPTQYQNALSVKGDIYYYNGQSTTGVTFFQITELTGLTNFGGVTVLACGYDELGLAAYEASGNTKIRRVDFTVWQALYPSGTTEIPLTETRSYLLEIDEQPQKFDVAWLSRLGTYETFSFVGEVVESEEIQRQTYQSPYNVGINGEAGNGFQYNGVYDTLYTKTWTVNSGTVDEDTYYYLQDMLRSNKLYNYSATHQHFLTIIGQTSQKSTNQGEYTVQVVFRETIFENQVEK